MRASRRRFLAASAPAALGLVARPAAGGQAAPPAAPAPPPRAAGLLAALRGRFPDLRQRFVFEYYPWYGRDPWRHWDQWQRRPPADLASHYMPRLGAYDSRDRVTLERHARWIAESGAGAVNLSWWGGGSYEDRAAHLLLDVLKDHGLKATFHLEPYRADRGRYLAEDVFYLLRVFGERRRWDALLLPRAPDGKVGPVFKGFSLILPRRTRHCRGGLRPVAGYTPDAEWRRQTDTLRELLRRDFDRVTLLADSLHMPRTAASGFDGIAIYDNRVPPEDYAGIAAEASRRGLIFSLNVNPGFDGIAPRRLRASDCYAFAPVVPDPGRRLDWSRAEDREHAAALSAARVERSLAATLAAQADPALANAREGFLLVYVNSFNEWHEGHAFEPMKDAADLTPEERGQGYRNPARGCYRLDALRALLAPESPPGEGPHLPERVAASISARPPAAGGRSTPSGARP
jgi:sugar phosphate isomerase/epimerase